MTTADQAKAMFAAEDARTAAKIERDVWTDYFEQKKKELITAGMTPEAADDAAWRDIRREIHGEPSSR